MLLYKSQRLKHIKTAANVIENCHADRSKVLCFYSLSHLSSVLISINSRILLNCFRHIL